MKLITIFFLCIMITGCTTERIIVYNNTIEKPIEVIKECAAIPDCICNQKICEVIECDNSQIKKCQLEKARAISNIDYYKELIDDYIINETYDTLHSNLTDCLDRNKILNDKLIEINNSLS